MNSSPDVVSKFPVDWGKQPLGDICLWSRYGISVTAAADGTIPMLRMNNLQNGKIDFSDIVYVRLEDEEFITHRLNSGELLINRTNSYALVGKSAVVEKETNCVCASYIVRFGLDTDRVEPSFLNYYLNSHMGQYRLQQLATKGVSQANINPTTLQKFMVVPLPPLPEQRKIAEILGTWDEAIATVERLIAALEQRKQGLMQRLLTGQVRFPEFEGSEWETQKAGDIFYSVSKRNNGDEELLSATQEHGVIPRSMLETRVTMPDGKTNSYKLVEPGDFIISLRSFQGGIEYSKYRGLVSPAYTVLKPKLPIDEEFYKHLFKSRDFIGRLAVAVIGIRDGKQISYSDFAAMRLAYPSIDEQGKIADVLKAANLEIDLHQKKRDTLLQQKKGLMQRLLTGQVRVDVE